MRRFTQLVGIYPAGNIVSLDTGDIAVVTKVYAPDPHRPRVRVVVDRTGARLENPYDVDLWEARRELGQPTTIVKPVDPASVTFDPLALL